MELSRISKAIVGDSRLSLLLLGAIALTLAALASGLPRRHRRPMGEPIATIEERVFVETLADGPALTPLQRGAAVAKRRPPGPALDRPGTHDLPDVPVFPGAQRVANRTVLDGFVDQADYRTLEPPSAVAMFYFEQLTEAGWRVERLQPLDPGGHGWWTLFRSEDNIEVIVVYATTKWLDLPPGGDRNATHISVSRTNLPAEEIREALRKQDAQVSATPTP